MLFVGCVVEDNEDVEAIKNLYQIRFEYGGGGGGDGVVDSEQQQTLC